LKSFFQKLVLLIIALYLIYMLIPYGWQYIYSEETLNALAWNGYGGIVNIFGPVPYVFAAFLLVSLAGLYKFKKWGRTCFMLYAISVGMLSPIFGLGVTAGIDGIVSYFFTFLSGFIISVSYFSSISNEFK
jgi:hypothetical protein